ncbi:MAG: multicopy suppressor of ts gsp1 [Caeruleum heppii]|nr:MAG: multicopy suppressor of ts gsp1 [Caeruleum heppii]
MTVEIPENYIDASTIREIPDTQEVFLLRDGFSSIIFDLTERVTEAATDEQALRFHFSDVVGRQEGRGEMESGEEDADQGGDLNGDGEMDYGIGVSVLETGRATAEHLGPSIPTLTLTAYDKPPSPSVRRSPNSDFTLILLTLIRLERQSTDVAITLNVPYIDRARDPDAGNFSWSEVDLEAKRFGPLKAEVERVRDRILRTVEVKDWGLFL